MKSLLLFNFISISFWLHSALAQSPMVLNVSPTPHTIVAPAGSEIVIEFHTPIDPATISEQSVRVFGKWSGPASGSFSFENNNEKVIFLPSENFFAGEWISISLTKGIKSANGENMETGFYWGFWIKTKEGILNQPLEETIEMKLPNETYIQVYGAYAGDMNNDGYSDLVAVNENSDDLRILLNDQTGHFLPFELYDTGDNSTPSPSEGADFNNDGEIDMVVTTAWDNEIRVLTGDGNGSFTNMDIYYTGNGIRGVVCHDFNGDGWDDMLTTNRLSGDISLLMNDEDGTFTISNMNIPGQDESACALADANNDGIADIFYASFNSKRLGVMLGDGNGNFEVYPNTVQVEGRPWSVAVGDLNADGLADVVSVNSNDHSTAIAFGDGMGGLSDPVHYAPANHNFPVAVDLGDLDGDGDLDIVTSNYSSSTYTIFQNNGNGLFLPTVTLDAPAAASCAILHDRDNDGDLDITGTDEEDDVILLFENIDSTLNSNGDFFSKKIQLKVYPNPTASTLNIEYYLDSNEEITYSIYDSAGLLIYKWKKRHSPGNKNEIWLVPEILKAGNYQIEVKHNEIKATKRFSVIR